MIQIKFFGYSKTFGSYPECDYLNNAIRFIDQGKTKAAIDEIAYVLQKYPDVYIHDDVKEILKKHGFNIREDKIIPTNKKNHTPDPDVIANITSRIKDSNKK